MPLRPQLEALVAQLRADLASSRESAEALRRDLRTTQADGEGRARERDESTRNLRNELRDADETIGCVNVPLPGGAVHSHSHLLPFTCAERSGNSCGHCRPMGPCPCLTPGPPPRLRHPHPLPGAGSRPM
jgi:hypothetical protein